MKTTHVAITPAAPTDARRLWNDNRVWWVNCIAVESAWLPHAAQYELPILRQRRDALLEGFMNNW